MAQVYVPDNPRERAQLEQPVRGAEPQRQTYPERPEPRRFGGIDTYSTTGLGASIAEATAAGHFPELLAATLLMAAVVVLLNRLAWRRMYGLAERRYTLA
jgi:hypothetical protein